MKALTVRQPWANAIIYGGKDIENRTWKPPEWLIGQVIAIHSSKTVYNNEFRNYRENFGEPIIPCGYGELVGFVRVDGWTTESDSKWFIPGQIGWELSCPMSVSQKISLKGKLKLWDLPKSYDKHVVVEPHYDIFSLGCNTPDWLIFNGLVGHGECVDCKSKAVKCIDGIQDYHGEALDVDKMKCGECGEVWYQ